MLHVTMKKYVSMSTSRRHFLIASRITKYKVFFSLLSLSNHLLQPDDNYEMDQRQAECASRSANVSDREGRFCNYVYLP